MKPYKVLLFIGCVMACLAVLCVVLSGRVMWGGKELRWPTLAEVFEMHSPSMDFPEKETDEMPVAEVSADTVALPDTLVPDKPKPVIPHVVIDSTTDSRAFLRAFYAALSETGERTIRVLHYGDSQIEEDRMTMEIRGQLQKRYGGRGIGLMPLAQTIPSLTVDQRLFMNGRYTAPQQGPRRYLVYGPKSAQRADGLYGPMGQVAVMNDSLVRGSEDVIAVCTPKDNKPRYTRWKVFADSSVHYSFAGDSVRLSGRGMVYGLSQQSENGVIVDNIPMRGCMGLVFTKMNEVQLRRFYQDENVRLIIMQFGGNAIPSNEKPGTIAAVVQGLREQVRFVRRCAPEASILFIGPSDMMRQVDGEWETYPLVPYMDKLLHKMAQEEQVAYFSLYRWMGGAGSMKHWQEVGLAGADGVHFYRGGARKAGDAVVTWILEGKDITDGGMEQ